MKLKLILLSLVILGCVSAASAKEYMPFPLQVHTGIEQTVFNEMRPIKVINIDEGTQLIGMHFRSFQKKSANVEEPWIYVENDGSMRFEYNKMQWSNGKHIKIGANQSLGIIDTKSSPVSVTYHDALGGGVDIKIVQDNYRWQKIVEIESLASLGPIPNHVEYLEISFNVSGNFVLPDGLITDPIPFGNNSFIHPVRAWDCSHDLNNESGAIGTVDKKVITKRIPLGWLKSAQYPVRADVTITYGLENVFNSASTDHVSVAALNDTHFVVAYRDLGNSSYGTAIVGVVSGSTISSYGAENVFNLASTAYISVAALDDSHFVISYQTAGSYYGTAIVGLVSGSTISSYGPKNVFNSASTAYISVTALDSTHFVVAYKDDGGIDYGIARIGLVSGTTISSYGAENVFNSASTSYISLGALDDTHFVVAYRDHGNLSYGTAIVGLVSGTTISSYGAQNVFNSATSRYISVGVLNSTHFVVAYQDYGGDTYGYAIVGLVSGTTISSYGGENVFNTADIAYISLTPLDTTHFVISYRDIGNSNCGTAIVGVVSGTTISSYGDENVFNIAITTYISVTPLDSTHFVVSYRDEGGADYGCAILGEIEIIEPSYLNISLHSVYPESLESNYTGKVNISYIVNSSLPLNYSTLAFLSGVNYTITGDTHNFLKVPANNISSEGMYRAQHRNRTPYLSWEFNNTITEGNVWRWGGGDNNSLWITKTCVNDTHTFINISGRSYQIFPNSFYLAEWAMYEAEKTQIEINRAQGVIYKVWDLEQFRDRGYDYYIHLFMDTSIESLPNDNIEVWYCNCTFDPLTHDPVDVCDYKDSWSSERWLTHNWSPHTNASYTDPLIIYAGTETCPSSPCEINYIYLRSGTTTSKSYELNVMNNEIPGINVSFADTGTMWTYNEISGVSTPISYTPSAFQIFTRNYLELQYQMYIANTAGTWGRSGINTTPIGLSNILPTYTKFNYFWWNGTTDYNMTGTYRESFNINLTYGFDPDNDAPLNHTLSLYDFSGTYVKTINSTLTGDQVEDDVYFDTTGLLGRYRLRIISTDNEDTSTISWSQFFYLDGAPLFYKTINVLSGFPNAAMNTLNTFLSYLPLFVGLIIAGFLIMVCVGVFGVFKQW